MSDKKNVKNKMGNIQKNVLVRTLFPMVIMGIIIAISIMGILKSTIKNEISKSLESTASMTINLYELMYPGEYELKGDTLVSLYKGEKELTGQFDLLDKIKKDTGHDVTLFYGNTRILTTLKDEYGNRFIATGLNAAVINDLETKNETAYYEVDIEGKQYYACYSPIYTSKGQLICIMGVAVLSSEMSSAAIKAVTPIWIICLVCMLFAGFISVNYTGSIVGAIRQIDEFLKAMTKGELGNDMSSAVLKRTDELGTTAKAVVEMQNAIRVLVERDPLTQLYNRRYGGARLRKIQAGCEQSGLPYSVVLGDIDFFKKVNDTYGHEAGDIVLKKVSEILRKSMAGKGFVARWGGEEFLVIFSKVGAEKAAQEMEEILNKIRKMEIIHDGKLIKVTMSFGVVDGGVSKEFSELLRRADERLYYGKSHGRNRIVTTDEIDDEPVEVATNVESPVAENTNSANEQENEDTKAEASNADKDLTAVIDDAFLEQLIEKMNEKLYKETLGEDAKK